MTARRVAHIFLVVGALCLLLYRYPDRWPAKDLVDDLYANASTSLLSIAITVLLIDRLNDARAEAQDKKRLVREMGSEYLGTALRAAAEVTACGWVTDGSLRGADFARARLEGVRLTDADLAGTNLSHAVLKEGDLSGASLRRAVLQWADAERCTLKGADLTGANLRSTGLAGANLEGVTITAECDLLKAQFAGASMRGAFLAGAEFEDCDLRECDLTGADLRNAVLRKATVTGAILDRADLERADLTELRGWKDITSMRDAQIAGVRNAPPGFEEFAVNLGAKA